MSILAAAGLVLASAGGPAFAEKKVALVIGNGGYADAPLKNPPSDARAIAATLKRQGFDVLLRENATKAQMNEVVADFGEKLGEGDTALFFYAGHGMQVQGRNYLIPTDAKITSEQRVRLETLDVEAVLDQMAAARARVSMVILDACRNNPFERRFRSVGGGLAQINAPEGTMIAYATSPGKVAADGEGANGLYTQELLKALAQPGLKVEDVFKQVRIGVTRASNGAQVPWEASSLTGDFYFEPALASAAVKPSAAPAMIAAPAPAASIDREGVFWDTVKGSSDPAELHAYLDTYPTGVFAPIARARVASLEAARQQQVVSRATPAPAAAAPAPAPAAPAPAPVASAPPQQVAAAPAARAGRQLDGMFSANVPGGVLVSSTALMFASIQRGVIRLSAQDQTGARGGFGCTGQGDVAPDGTFSDVEVNCRANSQPVSRVILSGTVTPGNAFPVTFEATDGKKTVVSFK
ncbi:MAG: caspase family protein [Proteobacteria bacterium]|nr:caspase family protein [Pseudomonadota bacterium]